MFTGEDEFDTMVKPNPLWREKSGTEAVENVDKSKKPKSRIAPEAKDYIPPVKVRYQDLELYNYSKDYYKTLQLTDDLRQKYQGLTVGFCRSNPFTVPGEK